jgi:hypothetical protein
MSVRPYRVENSGLVMEQMREIIAEAKATGRVRQVQAAFQTIARALAFVPLDLGESRDDLSALRLSQRIAFVPPLVVHFAVSEQQRIVWIKHMKLEPVRG